VVGDVVSMCHQQTPGKRCTSGDLKCFDFTYRKHPLAPAFRVNRRWSPAFPQRNALGDGHSAVQPRLWGEPKKGNFKDS